MHIPVFTQLASSVLLYNAIASRAPKVDLMGNKVWNYDLQSEIREMREEGALLR